MTDQTTSDPGTPDERSGVMDAAMFDRFFASKEIVFDRAKGWAVGELLYYRCPSCLDVLPSRPARSVRCLCHGVRIAANGGVQAKEPARVVLLLATQRDKVGKSDLSAIALGMALTSAGYAILAALAVTALILVAGIARLNIFSNRAVWPLIAVVWVTLEARLILKIWRSAQLSPPVHGNSHALHQLELAVAGFLLLFALASPYLTDSDASSFPYLRMLFEGFIGIVILNHCLVLALFKTRPGKWDVISLSVAAVSVIASLF